MMIPQLNPRLAVHVAIRGSVTFAFIALIVILFSYRLSVTRSKRVNRLQVMRNNIQRLDKENNELARSIELSAARCHYGPAHRRWEKQVSRLLRKPSAHSYIVTDTAYIESAAVKKAAGSLMEYFECDRDGV